MRNKTLNKTIIEEKDLSTVSINLKLIEYDTVDNPENKENTTAIDMDPNLENDKQGDQPENGEDTILL